ncbi:MAG TPA: hypothetical protein VGK05_01725 [Acidimicrobiia bacterium]
MNTPITLRSFSCVQRNASCQELPLRKSANALGALEIQRFDLAELGLVRRVWAPMGTVATG